jgi:hypothetical protein
MTENPSEPSDQPAEAIPDQPVEAPQATGRPLPPPPQPGYQPYPPHAYGLPPGAFAPVPREPWFNPAHRTRIGLIAALLALVLLGAGFGIGYGVAPGGGHHVERIGIFPGRYAVGPDGGFGGVMQIPGRFEFPKLPAGSALPTPSSSATG